MNIINIIEGKKLEAGLSNLGTDFAEVVRVIIMNSEIDDIWLQFEYKNGDTCMWADGSTICDKFFSGIEASSVVSDLVPVNFLTDSVTITLEADRFVFTATDGSKHDISADRSITSHERLAAHFNAFLSRHGTINEKQAVSTQREQRAQKLRNTTMINCF
jgi:hypothetical protein